MHNLILLCLRQ